jgi:hypothetical protein
MTDLAEQSQPLDDALPLGPRVAGLALFRRPPDVPHRARSAVLQNMLAELGQGRAGPLGVLRRHRRPVKRSLPPIFNTVYGADGDNPGTGP